MMFIKENVFFIYLFSKNITNKAKKKKNNFANSHYNKYTNQSLSDLTLLDNHMSIIVSNSQ